MSFISVRDFVIRIALSLESVVQYRNYTFLKGRRLMERKIFLSDLDGTLLDENKLIAPATRKAEASIKPETVEAILDLAESLDVHCHTYLGPYIVTRRETEALNAYRFHIHMPLIVTDSVSRELTMDPCLLLAIEMEDHSKLEKLQHALAEDFSDQVMGLFSSSQYLDILPAGTNKGNALRILAEALDVPMENTLAAGDEENDISMIEKAGVGIAMINGTDRIKELADIVTEEDNTRDGLAEVLNRLMES